MQRDQLIACDGRLIEPHDLRERHIEGALRAKAPLPARLRPLSV
ncbi:MAG TPA: hypothetical protein VFA78_00770 [Chloroflexota bacterium]|nr:hypothetical protein [Chloroflexota bacterium]